MNCEIFREQNEKKEAKSYPVKYTSKKEQIVRNRQVLKMSTISVSTRKKQVIESEYEITTHAYEYYRQLRLSGSCLARLWFINITWCSIISPHSMRDRREDRRTGPRRTTTKNHKNLISHRQVQNLTKSDSDGQRATCKRRTRVNRVFIVYECHTVYKSLY